MSVTDKRAAERPFAEHQPAVVFHTAEHNIVSLMEQNPIAAVENNVFGTKVVVDCAIESGVELFVLRSREGAGCPANIVDVTKRLAELYVQAVDRVFAARAVSVRLPYRSGTGESPADAGEVALLLEAALASKGGEVLAVGTEGASANDETCLQIDGGPSATVQASTAAGPDLQDLARRLQILRKLIERGDEARLRRLLAQVTSPGQ
jgi:nucleoside-diphosphate-sugar epimerase